MQTELVRKMKALHVSSVLCVPFSQRAGFSQDMLHFWLEQSTYKYCVEEGKDGLFIFRH